MEPSYATQPELDGLRILFVDDSEDERELFLARFGMLVAAIVAVGSVDEALAEIARHETDVFVCDLVLPDSDGCDLVRTLRDDEVAAATPAIAATGLSGEIEKERALAAGFSAIVTKPYGIEEILLEIASLRSQIETLRIVRARCQRQRTEQSKLRAARRAAGRAESV
jgi:CheY-like chemotaxis protein